MSINDFTYKYVKKSTIFGDYYEVYQWEIKFHGTSFTGESTSIRQAYRHAKRAVRRYRKMWNLLNPNEPRI